MLANVFTKTLRDATYTLAIAVPATAVLSLVVMFAIEDLQSRLSTLTEHAPEAFTAIFGTIPAEAGGYVVGELYNLIGPALVLAIAIGNGAAAISGEERRRTLDLLLANPVSRREVILSKAGVMVVPVAAVAAFMWAGLALGAGISSASLTFSGTAAASLHLTLLGVAFGWFALALSAWTGTTGVAAAVAGGLAAVSYIATPLLPLIDGAAWAARLFPFWYYNGADPIQNGIIGLHLAVLVGLAVLCLLAAVVGVRSRDLVG